MPTRQGFAAFTEDRVVRTSNGRRARSGTGLRSVLLASGMILSTATYWRFGGPIGAGELLLVLWLSVSFLVVLARGRVVVSRTSRLVLSFWSFSLTLLLAGALVAIALGVWKSSASIHDLLALSFAAVLGVFMVIGPNADQEIERAGRYFVFLAGGALGLLYCSHLELFALPGMNARYAEARFTGWAENPNQMALLSLVVPFIALRSYRRSTRRSARLGYLVTSAVALLVGVSTASDALLVSWLLCGVSLIAFLVGRWLLLSPKRHWEGFSAYVLLPFVGLVLILGVGVQLVEYLWNVGAEVYGGPGAQGSVRIALWRNGIEAMGLSPLVGLGPGSYSGVSRPLLGNEAHNTFIDWGMSTGVAGLLAYVVLIASVLRRTYRRGDFISFAGVSSLLLFSAFHYVLRHPVFWFYLIHASGRDGPAFEDRGEASIVRTRSNACDADFPSRSAEGLRDSVPIDQQAKR